MLVRASAGFGKTVSLVIGRAGETRLSYGPARSTRENFVPPALKIHPQPDIQPPPGQIIRNRILHIRNGLDPGI